MFGMDIRRVQTWPGAWPENGNLLYKCQNLTCRSKDQSRRYVDLVPVVFSSGDGLGYTRDVCAERWTVLNDGDRSIRGKKKEQTQWRIRRAGD